MVPWQIGKTTGTHKAKTVIPLNQRHVPRTSKARRQSLSSQNTHTKETQAKRRTNGFTAHGSMTWQNITKIPRKTPNFQFLRDSIFYHARFLYTAPQLNPLQPFLSPLAPKTKPSQHNANPRSNKTTFSLFLSHRVFFADSETLTRTESPRFRNSSSSILCDLAMPKAKADAKVADNRYRCFLRNRYSLRFQLFFLRSDLFDLVAFVIFFRFVLLLSLIVFSFVTVSFRLKRKGAGAGRKQSKKAAKDPNKPKRPPSAFFVFMYV